VFTFLDRHTALLDLLIDSSGEKCDRIERVLHFDYAACRWQRWLGTLRVVDEDLLPHSVIYHALKGVASRLAVRGHACAFWACVLFPHPRLT